MEEVNFKPLSLLESIAIDEITSLKNKIRLFLGNCFKVELDTLTDSSDHQKHNTSTVIKTSK